LLKGAPEDHVDLAYGSGSKSAVEEFAESVLDVLWS
jgi:hypothetical protein